MELIGRSQFTDYKNCWGDGLSRYIPLPCTRVSVKQVPLLSTNAAIFVCVLTESWWSRCATLVGPAVSCKSSVCGISAKGCSSYCAPEGRRYKRWCVCGLHREACWVARRPLQYLLNGNPARFSMRWTTNTHFLVRGGKSENRATSKKCITKRKTGFVRRMSVPIKEVLCKEMEENLRSILSLK